MTGQKEDSKFVCGDEAEELHCQRDGSVSCWAQWRCTWCRAPEKIM